MNAKQEEEALFWCGLLTPVLFGELDKGEVCQKLRELSEIEVVFPSGSKRRPSLSTLKRKYKKIRFVIVSGSGCFIARFVIRHREVSLNAFSKRRRVSLRPKCAWGDMFTLDRLNEGFATWLNVIYHQTIIQTRDKPRMCAIRNA